MPDAQPGAETPSMILRDWSEVRLFEAAVVLIAGLLVIAALKWLIPRAAARLPDRFRFYLLPWEPVLRLLILLFLFVYLVPFFIEPTTENLLAIAGATAVAFGFALKDYVSSLIAGVVALYERPYRAGDWVTIEGTYGEVRALGLRTVQVLTPDDTMVAIPQIGRAHV